MRQVFSTSRLILREIETADLEALHRIYSDPECMTYYPAPKSPAETRDWFHKLAFDSYRQNGFGLWAVIDRNSGEVMGDCGLTLQATPYGIEPEIGYHLWRDFWHRGFATEAARGCIDFARREFNLRRVVSIVSPENLPSQRVALRVHQRWENYTKTSVITGRTVERLLFVTEFS